jgi:CspA family cold shock protein
MKRGVVKFYSTDSKYGFIKPDDGSKDVFFHENDLKKSGIEEIQKNQKVEYELNVKGQKTFASKVKILD